VKVQALESIKDLFKHKYSPRLHFGHRSFTHFGCVSGFSRLVTHFLDGVLFQDVAHIDDLPFLGNSQVTLGILSSCVNRQPYFIRTIPFFSFLFFFGEFQQESCASMWGHYRSKVMGVYSRPFNEALLVV